MEEGNGHSIPLSELLVQCSHPYIYTKLDMSITPLMNLHFPDDGVIFAGLVMAPVMLLTMMGITGSSAT